MTEPQWSESPVASRSRPSASGSRNGPQVPNGIFSLADVTPAALAPGQPVAACQCQPEPARVAVTVARTVGHWHRGTPSPSLKSDSQSSELRTRKFKFNGNWQASESEAQPRRLTRKSPCRLLRIMISDSMIIAASASAAR
jgi:hypothetical protein